MVIEQKREVVDENHHVIALPIDWLSEITIVDTPGTNAIIRSHETITTQFVPRSDLVLFITSSDRPSQKVSVLLWSSFAIGVRRF